MNKLVQNTPELHVRSRGINNQNKTIINKRRITMQRNQFTFYRSYYDALQCMKPKERNNVLNAVIDYALNENTPQELTRNEEAVFVLIKPHLDSGRNKAKKRLMNMQTPSGRD